MNTWTGRLGLTGLCVLWVINSLAAQSPLFEQLTTKGIRLNDEVSVALPVPLLSGRTSSERQPALEKLAERQGWDRFSRNSPSAPVHVELSYINDARDQRVGHNVYSAFIAYAALDKLKDQELMSSQFGSSSEDQEQLGFSPEAVPDQVLELAGIEPGDANHVRYSTLRIPLMNRVVIEGTARIEKTEQGDSVVIAWQLDPHFTFADGEIPDALQAFANRSRKVQRDELGKVVESDPVGYIGCGGYLSVRQTGVAENQLLIESRLAMHEPPDWFAGSNFLRSKFPAALQESAQSFRRKLARTQ